MYYLSRVCKIIVGAVYGYLVTGTLAGGEGMGNYVVLKGNFDELESNF